MTSESSEFSTRKRQSMGPGSVIVQKTAPGVRMSLGGNLGSSMTIRRNVVTSTYAAPNRPVGEAGKVSKESVATVMNTRGKEKRDLGDLNSKLANYIDKVKYMEACNKAMTEEIDRLRKMKGYTQDRVKEEYEEELKEARATIDTLSKEIAPLQAKILKLEDKVDSQQQEINMLKKHKDELQGQVQKLNQLIGDLEGELATLRNQLDAMGRENDMLKQDNLRLREDNDRIREDFEAAVTKQINAENERDALAEELQFTQDTLNAEIEELRSLLTNFKSVQPDIQKMWKSEFKDCIQAIQAEYNDQLAKMTESTERRCQERITSMENAFRRDNTDSSITKTENKTLKSQLGDNKGRMADLQRENDRLRKELEDLQNRLDDECRQCEEDKDTLRLQLQALEADLAEVMHDLEGMKSHNLDLELEIACYRKLLEGEENSMKRIIEDQAKLQSEGGAQLAGIIAGGRGGSSSQTSNPPAKPKNAAPEPLQKKPAMSESTGLVRVSRSSKCAISIAEIAQDGTFCRLENGSTSKDFDLSNWTLERKHPKGRSTYQFPSDYKLAPRKSVRIYANSFEDEAGPDDLVASKTTCKSWGVGSGEYKLCDDKGTEKANSKIDFQTDK